MRKRWVAAPVAAGALAIGGVAFAANNAEPGELAPVQHVHAKALEKTADWISADEARDIAVGAAGGGDVRELELDRGDRMYELEILTDQGEVDVDIDAITGEVLELEREDREDDDRHKQDDHHVNEDQPAAGLITQDEAIDIAVEKAGGNAQVIEVELDRDDGHPVYELELHDSPFEYEIDIDAQTGDMLDFEKDDD